MGFPVLGFDRWCITSRLPFPNSARYCCLGRSQHRVSISLPVIIMAQIILAILLASATAAILGDRRASRRTSQGRLVPCL